MFLFGLLVASLLVISSRAAIECGLQKGKILDSFNDERDRLKFPCKYNAVRQQCGKYYINMTPGNDIRKDTGEYYVRTMWVSITDTTTGQKWEGRTSVKKAEKCINNPATRAPFRTKNNGLDIASICDFSSDEEANSVSLLEKSGLFAITFGAYQEGGRKSKVSTWDFVCNDPDVVLALYPEQVCGNLTDGVVKSLRKDYDFSKDDEVFMYNVLNNPSITQTNQDCRALQTLFTNGSCDALENTAVDNCYKIVYTGAIYKKMLRNDINPRNTFTKCLQWVCGGYKDRELCEDLGESLDNTKKVSDDVAREIARQECYDDFTPL